MLAEIVLGSGWWKLLAGSGPMVANPDSLRSVRATAEDRALTRAVLPTLLNVGAY